MNTKFPQVRSKRTGESAHEKMIREKMEGFSRYFAEAEERRAQQHFLRRWAETIYLFKIPLAVVTLAGIVFIFYRFIGKTAGNLLLASITLLVGIGLLYAAVVLFLDAIGGDGHKLWRDSYSSYRRPLPSKGDIRSERFGLLIGVCMYLMWGLCCLAVTYALIRAR